MRGGPLHGDASGVGCGRVMMTCYYFVSVDVPRVPSVDLVCPVSGARNGR